MLNAQGVKKISALLGGWNVWVNDGNPVVSGKK
jgi:3-mercaptopyruvate sulfurtransferase SseA